MKYPLRMVKSLFWNINVSIRLEVSSFAAMKTLKMCVFENSLNASGFGFYPKRSLLRQLSEPVDLASSSGEDSDNFPSSVGHPATQTLGVLQPCAVVGLPVILFAYKWKWLTSLDELLCEELENSFHHWRIIVPFVQTGKPRHGWCDAFLGGRDNKRKPEGCS